MMPLLDATEMFSLLAGPTTPGIVSSMGFLDCRAAIGDVLLNSHCSRDMYLLEDECEESHDLSLVSQTSESSTRLNLGDLGLSLDSYDSYEIDSFDMHLPAPVSHCSAAAAPAEEMLPPARLLNLSLHPAAIAGAWGARRPFTLDRAALAALATSITLPSPSALPESMFPELCAAELVYGSSGGEVTSSAPSQRQRAPSSSAGTRPSSSGAKRARLGIKPADTRPRVKGRFVKRDPNEESGEHSNSGSLRKCGEVLDAASPAVLHL